MTAKLADIFGRLKMAQWRGVPFWAWVAIVIVAALVDVGLCALIGLNQ